MLRRLTLGLGSWHSYRALSETAWALCLLDDLRDLQVVHALQGTSHQASDHCFHQPSSSKSAVIRSDTTKRRDLPIRRNLNSILLVSKLLVEEPFPCIHQL